jgi:hypothetical protein
MSKGEKRLNAEAFVVAIADEDTFAIKALLVLARPVVICWVIL